MEMRHGYLAAITYMDAQLGRVLWALDRTLVVLDNLEQIAGVACEVVTDWLKSAPRELVRDYGI